MKNILIVVLLFSVVIFAGCTDPNPGGPGCALCAQQTQTALAQGTATATATDDIVPIATATATMTSTQVVVINTATATMTSTEVVIATATATATVTPDLIYCYVKITGDVPSTESDFPLRVWVQTSTTRYDLFGTITTWPLATIASTNPMPYVWESTHSDGYISMGASISYAITTVPANQGLYIEMHRIINGVDTVVGTFHPLANTINDGARMFF